MRRKEGKRMALSTLADTKRKKHTDPKKKLAALRSLGAIKSKHEIDSQEICREVRGKK